MYSIKRFLAAIKDSGGIKKNIAETLGCSRVTLDAAIARYPAVRAAFDEEKEKTKDLCEERLVEQIQQGNMTAIIWYSKTQMRDRGYVEKQENLNFNLDLDGCSDEELQRLAAGESPAAVLASRKAAS